METYGDAASVRSEVLGIADEVQERTIEPRAVTEHARRGTSRDLQIDSLIPALSERADRCHRRLGELDSIEWTQLESDRRVIRQRVQKLKRELEEATK
jgi:50S ribosomal subunit-associated GTPase HflX